MHPINEKSAVDNHFIDGSITQEGTVVNADWLNTVQDEICNAITLSGLSLNKMENDDKKQLYNAIGRIVQNAIINLVNKESLNDYVKIKEIENTTLARWTIACIESMLSPLKYPNFPKKQ